MPNTKQRVPVLAAASIGFTAALAVQVFLTLQGLPPLIPPLSLSVSQTLLGIVLLIYGVRLRRAMRRGPGAVNPFQAVRILVSARAGQLVGGILAASGIGFALPLLTRTIPAPLSSWVPIALTTAGGATLITLAAITERLCRVPPEDTDTHTDTEPDTPGEATADQPAFRHPAPSLPDSFVRLKQ